MFKEENMKSRIIIVVILTVVYALSGSRISLTSAKDLGTVAEMCKTIENLHQIIDMQKRAIGRSESVAEIKLTAYNAEAGQTDSTPEFTASMKKPKPGMVAVSRDLFHKGWTFGKQVYIEGLGIYTIEDLMAQRHKSSIDILATTKAEALKFGRQNRRVALISTPVESKDQNLNDICTKAFM